MATCHEIINLRSTLHCYILTEIVVFRQSFTLYTFFFEMVYQLDHHTSWWILNVRPSGSRLARVWARVWVGT